MVVHLAYTSGKDFPWINPVGGLGDTLMLSGVLKQVSDQFPEKKYNLITRTKYPPLLEGHPAISSIGHPPKTAETVRMDYWRTPEYASGNWRAYQILAKMFGLNTPVDEKMFVPWKMEDVSFLIDLLPKNSIRAAICTTSDSPRKQMKKENWDQLVKLLSNEGICVVQLGKASDFYIQGAYNFLGLTTPRQAISILTFFKVIITSDNFFMHAAYLQGVPAVVLWGPTSHHVYGYFGQMHIQSTPQCDHRNGCIGPENSNNYATSCTYDGRHCMDSINILSILEATMKVVSNSDS